jgi:PKD repeat protein
MAIGGLSVNFTDLSVTNSTTGVISWFWDFGDGNTSTQQNPTHNYATNGNYTVCLIASNTCEADTTCSTVTVSCLAPNAAFSDSINNLTVSFTDLSTQTPTSWFWDFGDGNTSTQQNPSHTYAANGTYTVCLTATNTCGSDSSCSSVIVNCLAPNAAFSDSTNNLTVSFTDLSTQAPTSWFWDFGDGNTSTQQDPSHTYAANGTYTVCLTATNTCGSDSSCSSVTVSSTVGIADIENNVQIYPNPVQEVLNIDLQGEAVASIYSTDGKLVRSVMLLSGLNTIETAEMENGIYVLKIESTDSVMTYQFVKE